MKILCRIQQPIVVLHEGRHGEVLPENSDSAHLCWLHCWRMHFAVVAGTLKIIGLLLKNGKNLPFPRPSNGSAKGARKILYHGANTTFVRAQAVHGQLEKNGEKFCWFFPVIYFNAKVRTLVGQQKFIGEVNIRECPVDVLQGLRQPLRAALAGTDTKLDGEFTPICGKN